MADTDATLRIVVSSAEAVANARRVRSELKEIGTQAKATQAATTAGVDAISTSMGRAREQTEATRGSLRNLAASGEQTRGALSRLAQQGANTVRGSLTRMATAAGTAQTALSNLQSEVVSLQGALVRLGAAAVTVAAPAAGAGGIAAISVVATQAASDLQDAADRADVASERFQQLRFAAGQLGVEADKVKSALGSLNETIDAVARGQASDDTRNALRRLGIDPREINEFRGRVGDLFREIIQGARQLNSVSARTNVFSNLFSASSAEQLLSFTEVGRQRIDELKNAADELGVVVDEQAIQKAKEANKVFLALWQTLKSNVIQAVAENSDAIKELGKEALERLPGLIDKVVEASEGLIRNFNEITRIAGTIGGTLVGSIFGPIGAALGALTGSQLPEFLQSLASVANRSEEAASAIGTITGDTRQLGDSFDRATSNIQSTETALGSLIGLVAENSELLATAGGAFLGGRAADRLTQFLPKRFRALATAAGAPAGGRAGYAPVAPTDDRKAA